MDTSKTKPSVCLDMEISQCDLQGKKVDVEKGAATTCSNTYRISAAHINHQKGRRWHSYKVDVQVLLVRTHHHYTALCRMSSCTLRNYWDRRQSEAPPMTAWPMMCMIESLARISPSCSCCRHACLCEIRQHYCLQTDHQLHFKRATPARPPVL